MWRNGYDSEHDQTFSYEPLSKEKDSALFTMQFRETKCTLDVHCPIFAADLGGRKASALRATWCVCLLGWGVTPSAFPPFPVKYHVIEYM